MSLATTESEDWLDARSLTPPADRLFSLLEPVHVTLGQGHGGRVNFMDLALLLAPTSSSDDLDKHLELKRRIERYFEGDEEAIPSIFEAILKRKLAGKHDDSDDELMEQFGHKLANDVSDEEFDSEED